MKGTFDGCNRTIYIKIYLYILRYFLYEKNVDIVIKW